MDNWQKDAKCVISKYLSHPKDISIVMEICDVLKQSEIDSFFYNIHYDKRRQLTIGNNIAWLNYYKDNVIHHNTYHAQHINYSANYFYMFLDMLPNGKSTYDMIQFNMPKALFMAYNAEGGRYTESFVFASKNNSQDTNRKLLENIDYLKCFCFYFKDKAHHAINNNRVISSHSDKLSDINDTNSVNLLTTKRYFLSYPLENIYLTQRELEIMKGIVYGDKIKEIARKHRISFRTVEKHIEHIKTKVGTKNRNIFFKILINSDLIHCIK